MALERNWIIDPNRLYYAPSVAARTQYFMWYTKAFLVGQVGGTSGSAGLWTVISSSNSTTASAGDLWGSTFDTTKIVRGAASAARSWILLRSPNVMVSGTPTPFYLTLSYDGANDYAFNAVYAKTQPSGGLTSSRPSSGDEWAQDTGGAPLATPSQKVENVGAYNVRYHGGLCDDGSFFIMHSRDGSNAFYTNMIYTTLAATKSLDQFPVWTFFGYTASAATRFQYLSAYGGSTANYGRPWNGGAATLCPAIHPAFINVGGAWAHAWTVLSTVDVSDATWPDFPLYICPGNMVRGRVQDFNFVNPFTAQLPIGAVDNPVTQMNIEGLWIPWSGSAGAAQAPII